MSSKVFLIVPFLSATISRQLQLAVIVMLNGGYRVQESMCASVRLKHWVEFYR
jgi:hypothetical protein